MRSAGRRDLAPPRLLGIDGKAALERRIRRAGQPGLIQHPQAVGLADRLDDPRQHQAAEHPIRAAGLAEAQHIVSLRQGIEQTAHLRRDDRQRPASRSRIQAQVKLTLPGRQPLPRRSLQQLQLRIIMSRADVLDLPRPAPVGVHDLDRDRPAGGLHRPHVRHPDRLWPWISARHPNRNT